MNLGMGGENGPEGISKAVASLPPDQMFELMKRMKTLIEENPQNARNMLSQNPQLAYALLQAQVIMRIVDPELVLTMLHKPPEMPQQKPSLQPVPAQAAPGLAPAARGGWEDAIRAGGPPPAGPAGGLGGLGPVMGRGHMPPMGSMMSEAPMMTPGSFDRMRPAPMGDPYRSVRPPPMNAGGFDRAMPGGEMMHAQPPPMRDPREAGVSGRDPRSRDPRDRGGAGAGYPGAAASSRGMMPPALAPHLAGAGPEKAELIMQVLKLTDEQIAMLPLDHRQSIMELKKQINPQ